jgi:hypothetical protein
MGVLALFVGAILITGCSEDEKEAASEVTWEIHYEDQDYEKLYSQVQEGMTLEEFKISFGVPGEELEVFKVNGEKHQTVTWNGTETFISCYFVDDICDYKNGFNDGWEKE